MFNRGMAAGESNPTLVKKIRRAAFGLTVIGLVSVAVACGGGDNHKYPKADRDAFMGSCLGGSATESYCKCAFEAVQAKYTYKEFRDIGQKLKDGGEKSRDATSELTPVFLTCIKQ